MHELSDGVVALPGGIGTLDELFETMTWRELGYIEKPVWLLGANGYWQPLLAILEHLAAEGFAPPELMSLARPIDSIDALAAHLA
jgi:uncharacterized protein (TIGR00730 family)